MDITKLEEGLCSDPFATKEEEIVYESDNLDELMNKSENTCDENEIYDKNNVKKRERKFNIQWLRLYPWSININGNCFCKLCDKRLYNTTFSLKRHEKCPKHIKKLELHRSALRKESKNCGSNKKDRKSIEKDDTNVKNKTLTLLADSTNLSWAKTSENDPNIIHCTICNKYINVAAGHIILLRHENTSSHQKNAQEISNQTTVVEEEYLYDEEVLRENNEIESAYVIASPKTRRNSESNQGENTRNFMNVSNNHSCKEDECEIIGKRFAWHLREMNKDQRLFAEKMCNEIMHLGRMSQLQKKSTLTVNNLLDE